MSLSWPNILEFAPHVQGLSPTEKWGAAGTEFSSSAGSAWILIALALLGLVGVGILVTVVYGHFQQRRREREFRGRADKVGLSGQERRLLHTLARKADVKQPDSMFTLADAFDRGAVRMLEDGPSGGDASQERELLMATVERLRQKLGFGEAADRARPTDTMIGRIPAGKILYVYRRQTKDHFEALVIETPEGGSEIEVSEVPVGCEPGEQWEIRFSERNVLWETDASVVKQNADQVSIRLGGTARCINRRRFVRVPTNRLAFVAAFPFERDLSTPEPPQFFPAALVEIAGPGVRLESTLEAALGEKVLVGMQFAEGRILQGLATVRRCQVADDGVVTLAAEMIGLTTSEVSELTRLTNLSIKSGRAGDAQAGETPGEETEEEEPQAEEAQADEAAVDEPAADEVPALVKEG